MTSSAVRLHLVSLTLAEDRYTNAQQVNAREIAARLDPARFQVTLLSDGTGPASILELPHVRAWPIPRRRGSLTIFWRLLRGGFDLLLYPGPGLPESLWMSLPRAVRGRARVLMPVEGDVRQLDEVSAWIRRRVDRLLRRSDAVFPITGHVAETLRARSGRAGDVVPVGVDLGAFYPRTTERPPGPLRVLSVGTVKAWKRPDYARHAALAFPDVAFTWIGEGDLLAREHALAPHNLTFTGLCARRAVADRYRSADVFLHPSRLEGLPKVLLEALASGLPVIAFNDYRPNYLSRAEAGLVVGNEQEMIEALRGLLGNSARRERMGLAARRLAEEYSWDIVAARWSALFEREAALCQHRRGSQRRHPG